MIPAPASAAKFRTRRKPATLRARLARRLGGRRILALAAAIGVPAMAAPADWTMFGEPAAALTQAEAVQPLAYERPGQNFPGSAFYFLEDTPRLAYALPENAATLYDPTGTGDGVAAELAAARVAGPAAAAFRLAGTGIDQARALHCLASAVYYEAASEAVGGQRAVAQVVLNRVAHPSYPNSVCGVVFQGSERKTGCQFTFTCDGSLTRKPMKASWDRALTVAQQALAGEVYEPVGLATHYHTIWINPYWASSLDTVGTIGAHRFYRWRGAAGRPAAFTAGYRGAEPAAAPHPRAAAPEPAAEADPVALARAYEEGWSKAAAASAGTTARPPAPDYTPPVEAHGGDAAFTAGNLPSSGAVRPEYANSGRWIAQPN
ncbi:cell wall hydrolase [Pelagerythrobacter aerophilus]|uniref:cell wall hydrolase n=1 Tax=Pelagerythrobacter aerophilus TaxID=2306995 RepID=UPI001E2C3D15|nr:cell wall hydrolase [Pelagerythrobacter aerophilus]